MLEHQPPHSEPSASGTSSSDVPTSAVPSRQALSSGSSQEDAVSARVTAEEFTAAVAAVEARRAAAARQADKTVPIGQAVEELGVNATPADIWAEVQARRSQPRPVPLAQSAARKAAVLLKKVQQGASPLLERPIADWKSQVTDYKTEAASIRRMEAELHDRKHHLQKRRMPLVGVLIAAGVLAFNVFDHGGGGNRDRDEASVSSSGQTRTLAEVKDDEPVSVAEDVLEKIEKGQDAAQSLVQDHGDVDNGWTLVKHNGHVYVRGFTRPLSNSALQVGQVKLYNDSNAGILQGNEDQEVTLRLDTLHVDKTVGGDGWREMDVSHVHPDTFIREED